MKYRKRPIVIEAFKWTGGPDQTYDPVWVVDAIKSGAVRFENSGTSQVSLLIDTLEGTFQASQGDYIIRGIKGELYPCKSDIFEATYEDVGDQWDAADRMFKLCEPFLQRDASRLSWVAFLAGYIQSAVDFKTGKLNQQLEAMNALVRANSAMGQGDIDSFVANYPDFEALRAENAKLKEELAALKARL